MAEAAEYTVDPIATQLVYMWNYRTNFEKLEKQLLKLEDTRATVQHLLEEATRNAEEIEQKVVNWLDSVNKINEEATKIIEDNNRANMRCFKSLCPDLKMRYQHSKKAADKANDVSVLQNEGKFDRISYRNLVEEAWHPSSKPFEDFESRTSTLTYVINALCNPNVHMVGVHGMGGVGKTMLAREVGRKTEESKIFDVVVFVEVSESPDIRTIQGVIADKLGLEFRQETEPGRANTLRERLKKETKILLILDNIWESLDLEKVGIPFNDDHRGCKLLLTARKANLLSDEMGCDWENNFPISILNEKEAWDLFKKIVGSCVEGPNLQSLAFDVAKECGGLPIAIVTVAKALKNKEEWEWKSALHELQHPSVESLEESVVATKTHLCIKLSYDHLDTEELKSTFLLCSTMIFISNASVEGLLRYAIGLRLFNTIDTMEAARDRVNTLIQKLKKSCLLLDTPEGERFFMLDVVCDVGRLIAWRDHNMFTMKENNVIQYLAEKSTLKNCTCIILHDVVELPEELDCQKLEFLYVKTKTRFSKLPDNFFKGMPNLGVLHLIEMVLSPLPASFCLLKKLQTLHLDRCHLRDIAEIGNLKDLKILVLGSDIEWLPEQIGELTQLKVLDLSKCSALQIIPPNTISRLTQLEELYMPDEFDQWKGVKGVDGERSNGSLRELEHLSQLTALQIYIPDAKLVPKRLIFQKLRRYTIYIGDRGWRGYDTLRKLVLKYNDANISVEDGIIKQLKEIEGLQLIGKQGVKKVLYELNRDGFPKLKHFYVEFNPELVYIVDFPKQSEPRVAFPHLQTLFLYELSSLEKICHNQFSSPYSFCQLRTLEVLRCVKLKNIFSSSIARHLSQLQEIEVIDCENIEEIFSIVSIENEEIVLENLDSLTLRNLPKLRSFSYEEEVGSTSDEERQMKDTLMPLFDGKVKFRNLKTLSLFEINLKYVFSSSIVNSFVNLQYLKICECTALENIIMVEEALREEVHSGNHIEFPSLKELEIENCPEFKAFIFNNKVGFPSLEKMIISCMDNLEAIWHDQLVEDSFWKLKSLEVNDCQKLSTVFPWCICERLLRLESLIVKCCGSVKEIYDLQGLNFEEQQEITSCHLTELYIDYLPNLKYIWNKDPQGLLSLQNLKKVTIFLCWSLKYLFPASVARSLLRLESLTVSDCGVEEIVAKEVVEESAARFDFPFIRSLQLHRLPELVTFYPGLHTLECPVLERLGLHYCDKLKRFISEFLSLRDTNEPFFLLQKLSFRNLKELELSGEATMLILQNQVPEDLFYTLKILELTDTDSKTTVLPLGIQEYRNLEKLSLNSGSYIEIFSYEEVKKHAQMLPSINHLALNGLFDLKQIWKHDSSRMDLNFQDLETLTVRSCINLISLMPSSASFQNLRTLEVWGCEGLKNLLTSSTAKSLVQLEKLEVFDCKMMIEVVANEGAMADKIIFSKLKSLSLMYLQNLSSFCSVNHILNFPILESLVVNECPKMKSFSKGVTITPSLRKLELNWKAIEHSQEVDLNTNIQRDMEKGLPGRGDCSDPSFD